MHLTMLDGKAISALTKIPSQTCYICKCKPKGMNDLNNVTHLPVIEENLKYGLTTMHAWIKFLECVLQIKSSSAYN